MTWELAPPDPPIIPNGIRARAQARHRTPEDLQATARSREHWTRVKPLLRKTRREPFYTPASQAVPHSGTTETPNQPEHTEPQQERTDVPHSGTVGSISPIGSSPELRVPGADYHSAD